MGSQGVEGSLGGRQLASGNLLPGGRAVIIEFGLNNINIDEIHVIYCIDIDDIDFE